ncbi:hypothetical protein B0H13DRAFT_2485024 [Mycena leptocephala]|nr:hypothetical protein B0H13DRAFT_2485024 [Mycena leptocephala]
MDRIPREMQDEILTQCGPKDHCAPVQTCSTFQNITEPYLYRNVIVVSNKWPSLVIALQSRPERCKLMHEARYPTILQILQAPNTEFERMVLHSVQQMQRGRGDIEGLVLEAASDESSREPPHTAEGDVKHSWATYMPHWPCYQKLTTFHWDGGLTQDIAAFLSRHRTVTELRLRKGMIEYQHQDGVLKSLVPNVRKLSIEATDLRNLVPGRAVDTLKIWGSWSGPFIPRGSILMTVRILSGTVAIVVQLLALQGFDNLKELVIFSDEQETQPIYQPIYPPSGPMEALLSMVVKLTRLRCLALVMRARQHLVEEKVLQLYALASGDCQPALDVFDYCVRDRWARCKGGGICVSPYTPPNGNDCRAAGHGLRFPLWNVFSDQCDDYYWRLSHK